MIAHLIPTEPPRGTRPKGERRSLSACFICDDGGKGTAAMRVAGGVSNVTAHTQYTTNTLFWLVIPSVRNPSFSCIATRQYGRALSYYLMGG